MIKIAFTGVAGSGKGACVSLIQKELGVDITTGSFAKPIKEFLRKLFPLMTDSHLYGEQKEVPQTFLITPYSYNEAAEYYISSGLDDLVSFDKMWYNFCEVLKDNFDQTGPEWVVHSLSSRRLQQLFGTEIMRKERDSVWIDFALNKGYNLIDDLRFPNEEEALHKAGYFLIRIKGKDSRIEDSSAAKHSSETFINSLKVDAELDNNFNEYNEQSLCELRKRIFDILRDHNIINP